MIDDHCQRINEQREVEHAERYTKPLVIVVAVCLLAIIVNASLEFYAAKRHAEEIRNSFIYKQCLSKAEWVQIDDVIVGCNITEFKLVKGMQ